MRLLHIRELRFQEFFDDEIPLYAILSHRWGPDEVSYQDFLAGHKKDGARYAKIVACCEYAAVDIQYLDDDDHWASSGKTFEQKMENSAMADNGWVWVDSFDWVWIDTCCIDKTSSAELSEAINSMYSWYQKANVCYAYLSDVGTTELPSPKKDVLRASKWFSRGWTLQELLAPQDVVFLDQSWKQIGTRNDMVSAIAEITNIDPLHLSSPFDPRTSVVSVAEKFSWAAERNTSRAEDRAYCLLGLFNINMPLLYGESSNAFVRLQQEIIKTSNDESIFLSSDRYAFAFKTRQVLSRSILHFGTEHGQQKSSKVPGIRRPPYAITNQGLEFHVPRTLSNRQEFLLPLNCQIFDGDKIRGICAIRIKKHRDGFWTRQCPDTWSEDLSNSWSMSVSPVTKASTELGDSKDLFLVPSSWVWSREDLARIGSEAIYLSLT